MANLRGNSLLSDEQMSLLARLAETPLASAYYLTGGTALAAFYLNHRTSEDLDFFTDSDVPLESIVAFVHALPELASVDYERKFDRRLFLIRYERGASLKVEFTHYPFARLEQGRIVEGITIDSLRDILCNKLMAMTDRRDLKDFVDLYFASRANPPIDLRRLVADAQTKFGVGGIAHILKGRFLEGPPSGKILRMEHPVGDSELREFFADTARRWIADAIGKT